MELVLTIKVHTILYAIVCYHAHRLQHLLIVTSGDVYTERYIYTHSARILAKSLQLQFCF
jgi:hypothetical protein